MVSCDSFIDFDDFGGLSLLSVGVQHTSVSLASINFRDKSYGLEGVYIRRRVNALCSGNRVYSLHSGNKISEEVGNDIENLEYTIALGMPMFSIVQPGTPGGGRRVLCLRIFV